MIETPRTDDAQWGHGKVTLHFARLLERELNAAQQRIKRLEEAGDEMEKYIHDQTNTRFIICAIRWREAKEDKL